MVAAPQKCFLCELSLVGEAVSKEHIIPNALGGRLKSKALLCTGCNSTTGGKIDAALVEPLRDLANAIGFERERGDTPMVVVTLESGERLRRAYDGHMWPLPGPPTITKGDHEDSFSITASNKREARKHLEGLKRTYPKLDVATHMANVTETVEYVRETMTFSLDGFSTAEMFRAVVKIAVSYYLHVGGLREHIVECIDVVKSGDLPVLERVGCLYRVDPLPGRATDAITNALAIVSDEQGRLFAYVELLRAIRFVVRMSDSYSGPPVRAAYAYDLLNRSQLDIDPLGLVGLPWDPEDWDEVALLREIEEVMRILEPREMPQ